MGWTSVPFRKATHTTLTDKLAFDFFKNEYSAFEFAMFHFVAATDNYEHNECYFLMRHHVKMKNFIMCVIVDVKDGEIYWKEIEESEAPAYTNCPIGFFKFVKAPNELAEGWRVDCSRKNIQFKPLNRHF